MKCCCIRLGKFPYHVPADIHVNMICSSVIDTYRSVFWSEEKSYGESYSGTDFADGGYCLHIPLYRMTHFLPVYTPSYVSRTSYLYKCISLFEDIVLWYSLRLLIFHVPIHHERNRGSEIANVYSIVNSIIECYFGSDFYLRILTYTSHGRFLSCHGHIIHPMNSCGDLNHHPLQGEI